MIFKPPIGDGSRSLVDPYTFTRISSLEKIFSSSRALFEFSIVNFVVGGEERAKRG